MLVFKRNSLGLRIGEFIVNRNCINPLIIFVKRHCYWSILCVFEKNIYELKDTNTCTCTCSFLSFFGMLEKICVTWDYMYAIMLL